MIKSALSFGTPHKDGGATSKLNSMDCSVLRQGLGQGKAVVCKFGVGGVSAARRVVLVREEYNIFFA